VEDTVHDCEGVGAQHIHQHLGSGPPQIVQAEDQFGQLRNEFGQPGLVSNELSAAVGVEFTWHLPSGPREPVVTGLGGRGRVLPEAKHVVGHELASAQIDLAGGGQLKLAARHGRVEVDVVAKPRQHFLRAQRGQHADALLPIAQALGQVWHHDLVPGSRVAVERANVTSRRDRAVEQA
jgi:hypothetical protein